MKTEVLCVLINQPYLLNVYGFGSFFRSNKANDCDLLLVVENNCPDLGLLHAELYKIFLGLGQRLSVVFDLTVLTEREHKKYPLKEHKILIPIM